MLLYIKCNTYQHLTIPLRWGSTLDHGRSRIAREAVVMREVRQWTVLSEATLQDRHADTASGLTVRDVKEQRRHPTGRDMWSTKVWRFDAIHTFHCTY